MIIKFKLLHLHFVSKSKFLRTFFIYFYLIVDITY